MLKRIYVNAFRTLVNFEATCGRMGLYLGPNGGGKSSLFDALFRLREFATQGQLVSDCFPFEDVTSWVDGAECTQNFELEIEREGATYVYELAIEHVPERSWIRMGRESLTYDGDPLFQFTADTGNAQLYHDDHTKGPEYPFDWSRSGVGSLQERPDNTKLTWFKKRLQRVFVVRPNPAVMEAESRSEAESLTPDLSNFASWFRHLSQEYQGQVFRLTERMREVLPGFDSFKLGAAGEAKLLSLGFNTPSGSVAFHKLQDISDGQRVLVALYTLLHCLPDESMTLCVDEPENFLALPEIQPWLDELDERTDTGRCQALLISHHPKLINFLAGDAGVWLSREAGVGPTRSRKVTGDGDRSGLSISQLVERGWIVDD